MMKPVFLDVEGIPISGQLYLPESETPYAMVCVCHGIPDRRHDPGERGYPLLAEQICGAGLAAFVFNFRGTGESGGNFDLLGWTRDLRAIIDYLWSLPEVDKSRLALLGYSGGAAVSMYVAADDRRISCLAACACPAEFTFLATVDAAQAVVEHFRALGTIRDRGFPPSAEEWLDGFRQVRPVDFIARIAPRPLLLVHGDADETVPVEDAHRLYAEAGQPKRIAIIEGAGHALRQDERATGIVIEWLKSAC
jgi:fermentation-respiration switch protein FrsA (DUF1100 family)